MSEPTIYLDYAAATPMDPQVVATMQPFLSETFYNPSATYKAGRQAHTALETARSGVAHWLGARSSEIIFTAGGTEANNLALFGVAQRYPGLHIVSTAIEHDSILYPMQRLEESGWKVDLASPDEQGIIQPKVIADLVTDETMLVSVGYANNEIGTVQPLRAIAAELEQIRTDRRQRGVALPLYFHTDACQASNYLDLHAARLGVELMTLNGGKMYGPKQSGVLYVKAGLVLQPLILGGGQERGLRSGTENLAAAVGFSAALDKAQTERSAEGKRLQQLQQQFFTELTAQISSLQINGSRKHRLPNNVHVTIAGQDNERLLIQLDEAGIQAAAGSACSASNELPSHVLQALGLSDEAARSSVRFTMGRSTQASHFERVVQTLTALVRS